MDIKEVSVSKTQKSMKPLDNSSFASGKANMEKGLPPMVVDVEEA